MRGRTAPQESVVSALVIGLPDADRSQLAEIFAGRGWQLSLTPTLGEARGLIDATPVSVVLCESDLPDGGWREILEDLLGRSEPPPLVVTSRLADELLWSEVLNRGGYDVLAKPLDNEEVTRVMGAAARHFDAECHRLRPQRQMPLLLRSAS